MEYNFILESIITHIDREIKKLEATRGIHAKCDTFEEAKNFESIYTIWGAKEVGIIEGQILALKQIQFIIKNTKG